MPKIFIKVINIISLNGDWKIDWKIIKIQVKKYSKYVIKICKIKIQRLNILLLFNKHFDL